MEKKQLLVTYPYELEGAIKLILQKHLVEIICEDYSEKIDIQLEIDVELVDDFIDNIKAHAYGGAQIIKMD